ncbi:hypothetical protein ACRU3B_13820 [Mycobacterium colombiense]|uniref:hypothetical protein n=1 Tax=Mycobacterium colombiense TaxID=339268 RepID=UPI00142F1AC8|nr:hypothetical protein [Mycobacterium colombiense]
MRPELTSGGNTAKCIEFLWDRGGIGHLTPAHVPFGTTRFQFSILQHNIGAGSDAPPHDVPIALLRWPFHAAAKVIAHGQDWCIGGK